MTGTGTAVSKCPSEAQGQLSMSKCSASDMVLNLHRTTASSSKLRLPQGASHGKALVVVAQEI